VKTKHLSANDLSTQSVSDVEGNILEEGRVVTDLAQAPRRDLACATLGNTLTQDKCLHDPPQYANQY